MKEKQLNLSPFELKEKLNKVNWIKENLKFGLQNGVLCVPAEIKREDLRK
jgi:hypothetical protein